MAVWLWRIVGLLLVANGKGEVLTDPGERQPYFVSANAYIAFSVRR